MSDNRHVPFLDLQTPHAALRDELLAVVERALASGGFVGGREVDAFEREFAEFCGVRHCVGVGSGTDALRFALIAAGVRPGDTVVTVPNTFIATAEAISQAGARPLFVDVDEQTCTMDPGQLRRLLESAGPRDESGRVVSARTGTPIAAVVPVHLFGQMADMDPILELAAEFNLTVVEDACQAHGAEYFSARSGRWMKAGSMGRAAAFSFYPGKNLGACGEAGAVTTDSDDIARACRMIRDHGQSQKYQHEIVGYNGRLDAIQAGFLRVKLGRLAEWNEARRRHARSYERLLRDAGDRVVLPHTPSWSRPVFHLYVVRVAERERVQRCLSAAGIGTGIHYPIPIHLSTAYEDLVYTRGDFPIAERQALEVLSLPMFAELTIEAQERVASELVDAVGVNARASDTAFAIGDAAPAVA